MNRSKKIMKNQGLKTSGGAARGESNILQKNKVLLMVGLLVMAGLVAIVCYINLRPRAILKVEAKSADGSVVTHTVYFKEAMYDIFNAERQYNSMAGLYEQMYGSTFWTAENVDNKGNNGAEAVKAEIMANLKQREILYLDAKKNGLSLTEEEKAETKKTLETFRKSLSKKQRDMFGLDEKTVSTVLEKQALADKYKKQIIDGLGIDEAAVKAAVSKKDYRQYDLQCYSFEKTVKDAQGNSTKKADAELSKARTAIQKLQKKAVKAKDFAKGIIADADNDKVDDETGITYKEENLLGSNTDFASAAVLKKIKKMKNGEISDVLEDDNAYLVVKMVNNNNPKAYEDQCTQAVEDEKQSGFDKKYKDEIKANYSAKMQSYWRGRVTIGYLTYDEDAGSEDEDAESGDAASGSAASDSAASGSVSQ